jgi:cytochrome c
VSRKIHTHILATALASFALPLIGTSFSSASSAQDNNNNGKALFEKRCGGCHALDRDKEGPRLGGVYGRAAGTLDSFQYSDALKKSKIVWTETTLDSWLTDTEKLVPNNDMTFHVEKPDERREIIAYLKQTSGK